MAENEGHGLDFKLKANMAHVGEHNFTLQVVPVNLDWSYSEAESEFRIDGYKMKADAIKQIVRKVITNNKDMMIDSLKVGSSDFLFEIQVPKRVDKERLKLVFAQIVTDIKNEAPKSKTETDSFKKFLDDSEF